jgi:NADH-quinone oxidoreductase subunit A
MRTQIQISQFTNSLLFLVGGILFAVVSLGIWNLLRKPNQRIANQAAYESGEEPIGSALGGFDVRFYMVALLFILFDVELIFLFPWAVVLGNKEYQIQSGGSWALITLTEAFVFIVLLAVGLAYAWRSGWLGWSKNTQIRPNMGQLKEDYLAFNTKQNVVK